MKYFLTGRCKINTNYSSLLLPHSYKVGMLGIDTIYLANIWLNKCKTFSPSAISLEDWMIKAKKITIKCNDNFSNKMTLNILNMVMFLLIM